ncbi:MAG: hypothetical protein IPG71_11080 [bacterium]|nr:hypothetical protein [bacterium]
MDHSEEQRLREIIRKELEAREDLRDKERVASTPAPRLNEADRQRIIDDEISRFYAARGNYKPFENEDGEVEWLTEQEILDRNRQIPVDVEELEEGQRHVRNRFLIIAVAAFLAVALMVYALQQRQGSIQVLCNVDGAVIVLNGHPTEFRTDNVLRDLPVGMHVVSVAKLGYGIVGDPARSVEVKAGAQEVVAFQLEPKTGRDSGQAKN